MRIFFPPHPAVTCDLPILPPYTKIVYDRPFRGDTVEFGFGGLYECLPPMVLRGNRRATCTADGTWTEPPECECKYEIFHWHDCTPHLIGQKMSLIVSIVTVIQMPDNIWMLKRKMFSLPDHRLTIFMFVCVCSGNMSYSHGTRERLSVICWVARAWI